MKKFAIISLACAIAGLLTSCIGLGLVFGIVALIFGILSRKKGEDGKGLAIAGIIIGVIAILAGGISAISMLVGGSVLTSSLTNYLEKANAASSYL